MSPLKQNNIRVILVIVFALYCLVGKGRTITDISGTINQFAAVTEIIGQREVRVSNGVFNSGEIVLLIQMKGASVWSEPGAGWGKRQSFLDAGHYEFLVVDNVTVDIVRFTNNRKKTYDVAGVVQLVKVPRYDNARITGNLTTAGWNGSTGGILAFIVRNELLFEADIDVTGKGFRGGDSVTLGNLDCITTNEFAYPLTYNLAGSKGEGLATFHQNNIEITTPIGNNFAQGKGSIINGGGGGNGRFAGGAGGANYGDGGFGGRPEDSCVGTVFSSYQATFSNPISDFFINL